MTNDERLRIHKCEIEARSLYESIMEDSIRLEHLRDYVYDSGSDSLLDELLFIIRCAEAMKPLKLAVANLVVLYHDLQQAEQ